MSDRSAHSSCVPARAPCATCSTRTGSGDIERIPAAAGGPKGLALLPLDRLLLQHGWLPEERPWKLIGASVGAWRMAALAQENPLAALDRVQHAYVHEQSYSARPRHPKSAPSAVESPLPREAMATRAGDPA